MEKYISPEKKKKMEEAEKIEEQKKLAEMVKCYHIYMYAGCTRHTCTHAFLAGTGLSYSLCLPDRVTSPERGRWT